MSTRSSYPRHTNWSTKSMRERIANEMRAQILKTADTEIRSQYQAKQAKLRKEAERLQSNLAIHQQPQQIYWSHQHPAPVAAVPFPSEIASLPPLPHTHVQTVNLQTQTQISCRSAIALPAQSSLQPAVPMYAFATAGCHVYEQQNANSYIAQKANQPQQQTQQTWYPANTYSHTNESQMNQHYVVKQLDIVHNSSTAAAVPYTKRNSHDSGRMEEETQAMAMTAPAASISTLEEGTFVRSNESVRNLDSAMNSVVNSVNYSVAVSLADIDHDIELDQDYENCLDFYCGGLEQSI